MPEKHMHMILSLKPMWLILGTKVTNKVLAEPVWGHSFNS